MLIEKLSELKLSTAGNAAFEMFCQNTTKQCLDDLMKEKIVFIHINFIDIFRKQGDIK